MRRLLAVVLLLVAVSHLSAADPRPLEVVAALTRAFNAHDVEALLAQVTDDVEWLSVQGAELSVETRGKDALREGMTSYFKSLPSARSTVEEAIVSGRFVTVRERAAWTSRSGEERSQAAIAVYEIRDDRVARVWYYPAE